MVGYYTYFVISTGAKRSGENLRFPTSGAKSAPDMGHPRLVVVLDLYLKQIQGAPSLRNRGPRQAKLAGVGSKGGRPQPCGSRISSDDFRQSVHRSAAHPGESKSTDGVCVNAISPAVVRTQILEQLTPEQVTYMTDRIPMQRAARPEEIAYVVHFLASPECSFVTAQCYDASGGRATY